MKTKFLIPALFLCVSSAGLAQQQHVGTWRINSATYTNAKMQRESVDRSQVEELKIITPTHFMWMSWVPDTTDKEKRVFGGAGGGRYTLDGIKYVESLEYASWKGYESNITDFSLRVEGDKMYQMGALSNQEGEKTIIEEEWQRENLPAQNGNHVGVWHLQAQQITSPDGAMVTTDPAKLKGVKIISPTHWMSITQRLENGAKEFVKAAGGTYTLKGDKYVERSEFEDQTKTEYTLRVEGDKLVVLGTQVDAAGRKTVLDEVYQREKETPRKVASRGR